MNRSVNTRIFVVDDHKMFVDGLVELLASESDFDIVGKSNSIADAKRFLNSTVTDIVLLDVNLEDGNGYSLHEWIIEKDGPDAPKVLYVTADDRLISLNRAMNLGAMAYLDKTGGWEEVATAVRRAQEGTKTLGMNVAEKLSEYSFMSDSEQPRLSVREMEVLTGMSEGLTVNEMSSQMGLTSATVRTCVSRLLQKLGARDRAHAVSIGYARDLIDT